MCFAEGCGMDTSKCPQLISYTIGFLFCPEKTSPCCFLNPLPSTKYRIHAQIKHPTIKLACPILPSNTFRRKLIPQNPWAKCHKRTHQHPTSNFVDVVVWESEWTGAVWRMKKARGQHPQTKNSLNQLGCLKHGNSYTTPKTSMEPENRLPEKEIPFWKP